MIYDEEKFTDKELKESRLYIKLFCSAVVAFVIVLFTITHNLKEVFAYTIFFIVVLMITSALSSWFK